MVRQTLQNQVEAKRWTQLFLESEMIEFLASKTNKKTFHYGNCVCILYAMHLPFLLIYFPIGTAFQSFKTILPNQESDYNMEKQTHMRKHFYSSHFCNHQHIKVNIYSIVNFHCQISNEFIIFFSFFPFRFMFENSQTIQLNELEIARCFAAIKIVAANSEWAHVAHYTPLRWVIQNSQYTSDIKI